MRRVYEKCKKGARKGIRGQMEDLLQVIAVACISCKCAVCRAEWQSTRV